MHTLTLGEKRIKNSYCHGRGKLPYSFWMMTRAVLISGDIFLNKIMRTEVSLNQSPVLDREMWDQKYLVIVWQRFHSPSSVSLYCSVFLSFFFFPLSDVFPVWHTGAEDEECQREQSVLIKDMSHPSYTRDSSWRRHRNFIKCSSSRDREECVSV